jgi:hypothetical protein
MCALKLTAKDRIALIRAKVERARKHFRNLELELISYRDKNLEVVSGTVDSRTGKVGGAQSFHNLPLLSFDALTTAGDVIHNLRSALDHLAHQLVLVGSPGAEPSRSIEFPIAKDAVTYEASKPRKVQGMRPDAVKAIDDLKPYKGGNDVLWRIHELDNIDKHRSIFAVGEDWLLEGDWVGFAPYWLKASNPHFDGVFDSDTEVALQLKISELIGDPEIIKRNALQSTLKEMVLSVDYLIARFEPLLEAS